MLDRIEVNTVQTMSSKTRNILTALLLILTSLLPAPLLADGPTQVRLQNAALQDQRFENTLVVEIHLDNASDVTGADIQLQYNPAQLRAQDANPRLEGNQISPGPLLAGAEQFIVANNVSTQTGQIEFAMILLPPTPPIEGKGVLATVTFEVLSSNPVSIEITSAELVSSKQSLLPVATQDLRLSAADMKMLAPSPATPPWIWWTTGIGGALLLLLLLLLARFKQVIGAANSAAAEKTKIEVEKPADLLAYQGHRALKRGDKKNALGLFNQAIERDPANAQAWLGKGLVAEQVSEKRICFERVLALNPADATAKTELAALSKIKSS